MTDMTLAEAIAEVQSVSGGAKTWDGWDFCGREKCAFDDAAATILNAVASGDLIPASDARLAVASAYQRAADWLKARLFWAPIDLSPEETAAWIAGGKVVVETSAQSFLALANSDDLAEVEMLKAERDDLRDELDITNQMLLAEASESLERLARAEAADAEAVRLREALAVAEVMADHKGETK